MKQSDLNILLLEDDPTTVDLIRHNLLREYPDDPDGLTLRIRATGRLSNGVSLLQSEKTDLLILDLGLPDSDGLETFIQVATRKFNVPVIIHTANRDPQLEQRSLFRGAQDFIVKGSVTGRELRRRVRAAITRHRFANSTDNALREETGESSIALIAENPKQHLVLDDYARRAGIQLRGLREPAAAVDLVRSWQPRVVLVHHTPPTCDALTAVQALRSAPDLVDIPIILMLADHDDDVLQKAVEMGVEEILIVPVQQRELHTRLTSLLIIRNQSRQMERIRRELGHYQQIIGSYFGQKYIEQLKAQFLEGSVSLPDSKEPPIHARPMSVLHVDLRGGFPTLLAETPENLAGILSSMLNDLMEMIISSNGSVADMSAESLIAVFGYPAAAGATQETDPAASSEDADSVGNHATDAVSCAIKLMQYFEMFLDAGLSPFASDIQFRFRIGVATGPTVAAIAGSFRRRELTLTGQPTLLSRELAEAAAKSEYAVFVSEETRAAMEQTDSGADTEFADAVALGNERSGYPVAKSRLGGAQA